MTPLLCTSTPAPRCALASLFRTRAAREGPPSRQSETVSLTPPWASSLRDRSHGGVCERFGGLTGTSCACRRLHSARTRPVCFPVVLRCIRTLHCPARAPVPLAVARCVSPCSFALRCQCCMRRRRVVRRSAAARSTNEGRVVEFEPSNSSAGDSCHSISIRSYVV